MTDRQTITLTGAQETLLATLYGKALDTRARRPILGDQEAVRVMRRIDYDFRRTGMTATTAAGWRCAPGSSTTGSWSS
ncbi:hypothetical protein [Nonomuraea recticatena]|uniref:hypothetical protein n=1 Tax=Nonomuraea recticatena TaxID=46178 RepID=UPI00360CB2AF